MIGIKIIVKMIISNNNNNNNKSNKDNVNKTKSDDKDF